MRTKLSLWLLLACVLLATLVAIGKATAAPRKKAIAHRKTFRARIHRTTRVRVAVPPVGDRAVAIARRMIGVPYRWGGSSPSGFDCSGLVAFAYGRLGVKLPHSSYELFRLGRQVSRWALKPGDLVFFHGAGHVGLYLGRSRFVAATHTGDHVRILSLKDPGYASAYDGARRLAVAAEH